MWGCVNNLSPPQAAKDYFEVSIYQGYPRLRREGFYLVCVHFLRAFARKKCTHTKDYFSGQLPAK